jgi:CubicO group peptidase (beta-lactamase class C family)
MAEFHNTGVETAALARLDTFMQAYLTQTDNKPIRGAVLAVTSGDRLVFARGYVVDKKTDGIMHPSGLFRIASATKPITGTAIHQLLEATETPLKVTDKVAPIVALKRPDGTPFKKDLKPGETAQEQEKDGHYFHEVTVRQCLTHRTGLRSNLGGVDVKVAEAYQAAKKAKAIVLPVDKYQVASWGVDQGLAFWPSDTHPIEYSNLEYSLLGMVIEKKSGRGYRAAVQHRVFGPVGVSRARIATSRETERAPGEVVYHVVPENKPLSVLETPQANVPIQYGGENFANKDAYGGWVLSAVDYARFLASFTTTRPLVSGQVADLLFWWLSPQTSKGGVKIYRHGAVLPGSAGVVGLRADGFSISLFIDTTKDAGYPFDFEGASFNDSPKDADHEKVLHKIVDEVKATDWPAHDLFPLHGVPANVTDLVALKDGSLAAAVRGTDQAMHVATRGKTGAWKKWEDKGGKLVTPPRLISWGEDHLDAFALGLDRALWHLERLPRKAFGDWTSLKGDLASEPCVVSSKPKRLDVFALGKDHDLRHSWRHETKGWAGDESLGGFLTTTPSAVAWGPDRLDIFALGETYDLLHLWHDPKQGWGQWETLGGNLRSYPEAISWGEKGRLDIFAIGTDRTLMHIWHHPEAGWAKWESLGGDLRCSPSVASWGVGRLDVFSVNANQELIHISFAGKQGWSKWETLGGTLSSRPKAVPRGRGLIDVLAAGRDQSVWHLPHAVGGWAKWKSIGGEVG